LELVAIQAMPFCAISGAYDRMMFASGNQPDDPVQRLLRHGERLGYLTYEMVNDNLPDEVVSPDRLDAFLMEIESRGIRLIDEADAP
jgi:hypothetical protein